MARLAQGLSGTFGNRWDDPEGTHRVLEASSTRFGSLIETLTRFRADLEVVAGRREIDAAVVGAPGVVPLEWFASRRIGVAELRGVYADIGAAASLAVVRERLAVVTLDHGLAEIDAAAIRAGMPRAFTQAVSRLVYECRSADGGQFAGIYYRSRLDDGVRFVPADHWGLPEVEARLHQARVADEHVGALLDPLDHPRLSALGRDRIGLHHRHPESVPEARLRRGDW